MMGYRGMGGHGVRGGFGMGRGMGTGMGVSGMSDYTTDFNGFGGFSGGLNPPDHEMTPAEREFMMGGHMAVPSMVSPTSRAFGKIGGGIILPYLLTFCQEMQQSWGGKSQWRG